MTETESLVGLLRRQVEAGPERTALVHGANTLSYGELWQGIAALARDLAQEGVGRGTRVLLYMDNCFEYVTAYYALACLSAVSVPLNTGLKEEQLLDLAEHAQSSLLLHRGYNATLRASKDRFATIGVKLRDLAEPAFSSAPLNENVIRQYRGTEIASIVYTSGTTGRPKGVMLSGHNLCSNTMAIVQYLGLSAEDRGLCVLPFYYVYGNSVLHTHLVTGATLILEDNLLYPQKVLTTMARERVSGFSGVPSSFRLLLNRCDLETHPLPGLRYVTQAGGPLAPVDVQRVLSAWPQIRFYVMYGQTEATARLTYLPPERLNDKLGSVGIPIPGLDIKILDEHGEEKPRGEVGEVCAAGPGIMMGYWRDPEATRLKMFGHWLRTGDLGYMDAEGYITLVGRNSDQIKTGDHRVAPEEVEQVIAGYEGVEEVAVVGVADALLGEAIKACVVLRPGAVLERRDLLRYCSERLAAYKLPKLIQVVDALPKTASGKIQRYLLREEACQISSDIPVQNPEVKWASP